VSARGQPKTGDTSTIVCGNRARIPHTIAVLETTVMVSCLQNNLKIILSTGYHRGILQAGYHHNCFQNRDGILLAFKKYFAGRIPSRFSHQPRWYGYT